MSKQSFRLVDLKMAASFMHNLLDSGIPIDQALVEMSKLQKPHKEFWLAASIHCRNGYPLSSYLKQHWPSTTTAPVEIGELTGKLPEIFKQVEETISLQLQIRKKLGLLIIPAGYILSGFGVCLFFLIGVIPTLIKGLPRTQGEKSFIVRLTEGIQFLIHDHSLLMLGGLVAIIGLGNHLLKQSEVRQALLAKLDYVPGLGMAIRALYYGLWSKYIGVMTGCGIAPIDAIRCSNNLLLSYMVPSVMAIAENAPRGLSEAVDLDRLPEHDPRQHLPVFVVNAFRLTDSTGDSDKHFQKASQPLINIGMEIIERFVDISRLVAIMVAAVVGVTPMLMYFIQMAESAKVVGQ
ncbi:type II secretion system F family protein [Chromobacterium piscinae]|uniref:type II secretion system F family protein n=1 Tax=Chromobacterium piscinae TaxID=686831 RepID=UPI001E59BBE6|nr:type II secretion system F family protein [Chromobacterium piscinae]MCD5327913.1 type II secretion system F family protein [Chromobacterium piscinae]